MSIRLSRARTAGQKGSGTYVDTGFTRMREIALRRVVSHIGTGEIRQSTAYLRAQEFRGPGRLPRPWGFFRPLRLHVPDGRLRRERPRPDEPTRGPDMLRAPVSHVR